MGNWPRWITSFEGKVAWLLSQYCAGGGVRLSGEQHECALCRVFLEARQPGGLDLLQSRSKRNRRDSEHSHGGGARGAHPAICLTGDLAFLHDSNGLLAAKQLRGGLAVIVIDNRGGGIFEYLPVAQQEAVFESHFATPQSVDLAQLCQAHGVPHRKIEDWAQLTEALGDLPASGLEVLELQTDRKADVTTMRSLLEGGN